MDAGQVRVDVSLMSSLGYHVWARITETQGSVSQTTDFHYGVFTDNLARSLRPSHPCLPPIFAEERCEGGFLLEENKFGAVIRDCEDYTALFNSYHKKYELFSWNCRTFAYTLMHDLLVKRRHATSEEAHALLHKLFLGTPIGCPHMNRYFLHDADGALRLGAFMAWDAMRSTCR